MATVTLDHVQKSFGTTPVLHDVTLTVADGELVVFVGPSGCGKSTLLRLIAGLETVSGGDIWIGDDNVTELPPSRRGVSMVFQSYALYPHMTVYQNIAFGLKLAGTTHQETDERVRRIASMLHIDMLLDRKPRALSGGQRQRVAIARAIVREPRVFLFDEPLSNLDAALRAQTRVEIAAMHDSLGATMIYVTHDQVEAMTLADRIVVLNRGRVEQIGTPTQLYHEPANLFVAEFLGSPRMNLFPVAVRDGLAALGVGETIPLNASGAVAGVAGAFTLGVRAEDIHLVHDTDTLNAALAVTVTLVEELGETRLLHGTLRDGTQLILRDRSEPPPRKGEIVHVLFDRARCHLFDAAGKRVI